MLCAIFTLLPLGSLLVTIKYEVLNFVVACMNMHYLLVSCPVNYNNVSPLRSFKCCEEGDTLWTIKCHLE